MSLESQEPAALRLFGSAANAENAAAVSDWVAWPNLDAAGFWPRVERTPTDFVHPANDVDGHHARRKIAWTYGNITQVSYVASVRKSILSMLYDSQVSNGVVKLDSTLTELGIDDIDALLPIEQTATVRQILTATSGVYHPSNRPGDRRDRPARGTVKPGSQFCDDN
jgi:hypothetical protein